MAELTVPEVPRASSGRSGHSASSVGSTNLAPARPSAAPSRDSIILDDESLPDEDLDSMATRPQVRCDERLHVQVKHMTESNGFNFFIIAIIFTNALTMALETEAELDKWHPYFEVIDHFCLFIYSVEFILKLYAEPKNYWTSMYNLFDFGVLAISFINIIMLAVATSEQSDAFKSLKVLRALRTLRTLRTVSFIKGLQVLVIALLDTIRKWVINIILLLLLLMFLFANMGYYFFGEGDPEHWGSLGKAMLTLFNFVTVDGWTDIQENLDEMSMTYGRIFTISFIFLGHFIFSNVFIGVVIMNISEATETYKQDQKAEREAVIKHKKSYMMMRQQKDVKQMMDRQRRGNFTNFYQMVKGFEKTLRHDDSMMCADLATNIIWMEIFINTLDHMDTTTYRIQQFHFEMANLLASHLDEKLKLKTQLEQQRQRGEDPGGVPGVVDHGHLSAPGVTRAARRGFAAHAMPFMRKDLSKEALGVSAARRDAASPPMMAFGVPIHKHKHKKHPRE